MKKIRVLCSLAMDPAADAMLREVADIEVARDQSAQALYERIGEADILTVRSKLPDDLFDRPNKLAGVIRHGTGLDLIPVASATRYGIPVANVPGVNSNAVAEHAIAVMLSLARRIHAMDRTLHARGWAPARALTEGSLEMAGKTVGIIGVGAIGTALARICREGFGMRVLGYHPNPARVPQGFEAANLDALFAQSDFVVLSCPLNDATRGLVNANSFAQMKPGAYLVNVARGPVVDEAALLQALQNKRIAGAALDVFNVQPLAADHPLLALDNVLLTPHAASLTTESSEKMGVGTASQILQLLAGEQPTWLVNPEVWERRRRLDTEQ